MYYEPFSEERKEEIIEKMARYIVSKGLDSIASLFLNNFKSLAYFGSQFSMGMMSPFLMLFGEYEKTGFQMMRFFESEENVEALLQKIEELKEEMEVSAKEKEGMKEKEALEKTEKRGVKYYLERLWKFLV